MKDPDPALFCAKDAGMRMVPDRMVLTVARRDGGWCVELDGLHFGHSPDKEIARAAALRRARELQDGGKPCQVQVMGERGYGAVV